MSQTYSESSAQIDATPHKSIVAAWAIALILLSAGELFVSFHARIERSPIAIATAPVQRAAVEDALAW